MRVVLFIALGGLVACAQFPDLDARVDAAGRNALYPQLQPLDPLIAAASKHQSRGQITPAAMDAFDSRIANLRAKSAQLRGPVVDRATRARMRRGVAVPAAIR